MVRQSLLTILAAFLFLMPLAAYSQQDVSNDRRYNAVAWTQNSAEYIQQVKQAYLIARLQLDAGLADLAWTADEAQLRNGGFSQKPPAVILDVDETVLDNSTYNARGIIDGADYDLATWNDWANEKKAVLVPGVKQFIDYANEKNVAVYFVTNRRDAVKQATIENLKALGIEANEDTVLTRNDEAGRDGDKISRRATVAARHRILLLIGDNFSDFCSGLDVETTKDRNQIAQAKADLLGHRWIMLPNPIYGQWERALGDKAEALKLSRD